MKVLVLANCQGRPLADLLERSGAGITAIRVPPVHVLTPDHTERVHNAAREADFVLLQPLSDAFGPFATSAIKNIARGPIVTFHSIYFGGLFPYLTYMRKPEGGTLTGPLLDYHDSRIVRAYMAGKSQAECLRDMAEIDETFCGRNYAESLAELTRREAGIDVKLVDFIKESVSNTRLFYTFNHPANIVLWEVVKQFCSLAGTRPKLSGPAAVPPLDKIIAATAPEVSSLYGAPGENRYQIDGRLWENAEIVSTFYELYDATNNLVGIADHNQIINAKPAA